VERMDVMDCQSSFVEVSPKKSRH